MKQWCPCAYYHKLSNYELATWELPAKLDNLIALTICIRLVELLRGLGRHPSHHSTPRSLAQGLVASKSSSSRSFPHGQIILPDQAQVVVVFINSAADNDVINHNLAEGICSTNLCLCTSMTSSSAPVTSVNTQHAWKMSYLLKLRNEFYSSSVFSGLCNICRQDWDGSSQSPSSGWLAHTFLL